MPVIFIFKLFHQLFVCLVFFLQNSPVSGRRGLAVGYHVTSINGCPITVPEDWRKCLGAVVFYPPYGHCMTVGKVQQLSKTVSCKCKNESSRME